MILPIKDSIPSQNRPYAVLSLLILNVSVFLWQKSLGPEGFEASIRALGVTPALVFYLDRFWTFFTYMFLHAGWWHIIANLWAFWIFADNIEDLTGPWRFVIFYLLCGFMAALVHTLFNQDSMTPVVGASGAIAGVMGAYFMRYPKAKVLTLVLFIFVNIPAAWFLAFWVASQVLYGLSHSGGGGGIAWWAHLGGFAAGCVFLLPFEKKKPPRPWHRPPAGGAPPSPLLPPSSRWDD